jgi:hypothetical protein
MVGRSIWCVCRSDMLNGIDGLCSEPKGLWLRILLVTEWADGPRCQFGFDIREVAEVVLIGGWWLSNIAMLDEERA